MLKWTTIYLLLKDNMLSSGTSKMEKLYLKRQRSQCKVVRRRSVIIHFCPFDYEIYSSIFVVYISITVLFICHKLTETLSRVHFYCYNLLNYQSLLVLQINSEKPQFLFLVFLNILLKHFSMTYWI